MILQGRNTLHPVSSRRFRHAAFLYALAVLAAGAENAAAGSYTRTVFTLTNDGTTDSNLTGTAGGIGLAIEREVTIKLTDDQVPTPSGQSFGPDVVTCGVDTFTFFYLDEATDRAMARGVRLLPSGSVAGASAIRAFDFSAPQDCYFHVDKGENGYCASYVRKIGAVHLRVNNGSTALNIDTAGAAGWLFSSQCALEGDTFCVINSADISRIILRKVYSRGTTAGVAAAAVVAHDSLHLMNCSVAADGNGTICAVWMYGQPSEDHYFYYRFFDRGLNPGPEGSYAEPTGNGKFYSYDDVPVVAYGPGRFACTSWDQNGVLLHLLQKNGSNAEMTTTRVIEKPGVAFCTIASNGRYLVIACFGDVDGNGIAGIEGIRWTLSGYQPVMPETLSFSDPAQPVDTADRFSTAINAVIDDSGSIALTWRNGNRVAGCIWVHRTVRHRRGFYTSPVESLATIDDSIQFGPAQVSLSSTASWFTEDSLRFGTTPAACVAAPWISFSDQNILRNNRMRGRYFQFRIALNRQTTGVVDSFTTPSLSAVTIPWNTQPRLAGIDSVKAGSLIDREVAFGDTLLLVVRADSARIALHGYDADGGTVTFGVSLQSTPTAPVAAGGPDYRVMTVVHPRATTGTVVPCTLSVQDNDGWQGIRRIIFLRTRNSFPQLSLGMVRYDNGSSGDTVPVLRDTAVVLQEEDSIAIVYEIADSNDAAAVRGYIARRQPEGTVLLDSATAASTSVFVLRADTVMPVDTVHIEASVRDPDTVLKIRVGVLVNHRPRIRRIISGGDTVSEGDTINVVLDDTATFAVSVDDTDCAFGDTLFYRSLLVARHDSLRTPLTRASLHIIPDRGDTMALLRVTDRFGRSDSVLLHLAYPWYETDSAANPGYAAAKRELAAGPSLIDGSVVGDTITLPLLNSGNDRLRLTGCNFETSDSSWLRLAIDWKGTPFIVSPADDRFPRTIVINPRSGVELAFCFSSAAFSGDSVRCATVTLFTDDPRHRSDSFTVCIEHNDLPRIVAVDPDFIADRPYRSIPKRAAYYFPPHAAVAVAFSEPMDSAAAAGGIRIYSVTDARTIGSIDPIPLEQTWAQNYTVVRLSPRYASESPAFHVLPPSGLFIPTDSLALILTSALVDRAQTPSGPNALDINRDNRRDSGGDTAIGMRVDSIDFTVVSIDPPPGCTDVARAARIGLAFSSPVYAASVDTSLLQNRSLMVRSEYNGGTPLPFASVTVESTTVIFSIGRELFYRDSLQCLYRSRWISDRLGFSSDNSGDGIDATMFDTAACDDDLAWGYRVRLITVASVEPDSGAELEQVSPLVTIRFDDRLPPGVIDTDTSIGNRSFGIGSGRTGWSPFVNVRVMPDSTGVQVQPRMTFFSNDSVYCTFKGFPSAFRYANTTNLPDSAGTVFGRYDWSFRSGKIGFYTFPNPYKPGIDPRHCGRSGPCGIWFKNLHAFAADISEVSISIFSMTAHPVFDSRMIRFGTAGSGGALPQWLWDTRNNRGELVASGMYLYAIYDLGGKTVQRGKLIIVR
ncbi:MAG: hypothetical protein JW913_09410 [Chitinispirillaceae bacterium]|nr:hypothetical protein [Chitinispirillaceae bacterium]